MSCSIFLASHQVKRTDTAAYNPTTNPGQSEALLGKAKAAERGFVIDTKIRVVAPCVGLKEIARVGAKGSLTRSAIEASIENSLAALGVERV